MNIWNQVCETNPSETKKVDFGRKFTAIDAYAQIRKATELFGPYGATWGLFNIAHTFIEGTTMVLVTGDFRYPYDKGTANFVISSSILYVSDKGKTDDDFAKKVETDLITKALSRLGFNADVFLGKFDDNRYVQQMAQKFSQVSPEPLDMHKVNKATSFLKEQIDVDIIEETHDKVKRAWEKLTNDERLKVQEGLKDKAPDCNKMYSTLLKEYLAFDPSISGT